jgi:hypothetical protein
VFKVIGAGGHGSGFLVDERGLIMTNHHVVNYSDYLAVNIDERNKYAVELLVADDVNDIAILRVNPIAVEGRAVLPLAKSDTGTAPAVGGRVMAIGSPLATEAILTSGIVSKVETDVIYSDISIDEGNSGGPLFDAGGEVIGVNTFGMRASGSGISGVVRIHVAERALEEARQRLDSPPPSEVKLPVPSAFTFPASALKQQAIDAALRLKDYHLEADDFDATFLDPVVIAGLEVNAERAAAEARAKRNRDDAGASQDEIGSGFYEWRRYAGDYRPVVTIQVTPETKAALGPAFAGILVLRFKADFGRMELIRDGAVVEPFHPGRIREVISDTEFVYYGAYEFPPEAFEPGGQLKLRVWKEGQDAFTEHIVPPTLVTLIWSHFEPHYDAIRAGAQTLP